MPTDVLGTEVVDEDPNGGKLSSFCARPIFSQVVLADEINRTPQNQPKAHRSYKERQVTIGGETRPLESPFFVLATQNPIELEGTYPLPEAQLDRFLLNPVIQYLPQADEIRMVGDTTGQDRPLPQPVLSGPEIETLQSLTRQVPASEAVLSYAVRLVSASAWATGVILGLRIESNGVQARGVSGFGAQCESQSLARWQLNVLGRMSAMAKRPRHRILPSFQPSPKA